MTNFKKCNKKTCPLFNYILLMNRTCLFVFPKNQIKSQSRASLCGLKYNFRDIIGEYSIGSTTTKTTANCQTLHK